MMRARMGLFVLGLALVVAGCSKGFSEFESKEHKFKVMFPGTPQTKKQNVGVEQNMYFVDNGSNAYMVFHQDNPPIPGGMEKELLAKAAGAMAMTGKILKQTDLNLDGKYPGVEVHAEVNNPKGAETRNRIYLVGNKLYQVMVIGPASIVNSADANKFLDSFHYVP